MIEGVLTLAVLALVFTYFSRKNLGMERQITSNFKEFKDRIEDRSKKRRFDEAYHAYLWAGYRADIVEEQKALQRAGECLTSELEEEWQEQVISNWTGLRSSLFDKVGRFFQHFNETH